MKYMVALQTKHPIQNLYETMMHAKTKHLV